MIQTPIMHLRFHSQVKNMRLFMIQNRQASQSDAELLRR